jgi:hypothetical protein
VGFYYMQHVGERVFYRRSGGGRPSNPHNTSSVAQLQLHQKENAPSLGGKKMPKLLKSQEAFLMKAGWALLA